MRSTAVGTTGFLGVVVSALMVFASGPAVATAATPNVAPAAAVSAAVAVAGMKAPAGGDITALITANGGHDDVVLTGGDYTITIPDSGPKVQEAPELPAAPQTIYHGAISGTGTITVRPPASGHGTLVMTGLSTYSLPLNRLRTWSNKQPFAKYQYDGVALNGGVSPWDVDVLHGQTNDPAMTITKGATVHLNDLDGGRASIESYVGAGGRGAGAYNHDALRVDGTLVFTNNHHSPYETTIGPLSGTGDFINHQGGFRMSGDSTISGHLLLYGANINGAWASAKLTGVSAIYNALDLAFGATPKTIAPAGVESSSGVEVVPQTIYECCYGNAVYNIGAGEVRFTGKFSYSDSQDQLHPGLSNPKLNYVAFPKGNSQRIVDLGAGITTFGDGTDADFWLPSGWGNAYIGTHHAYALGFDYNGTVRMNVPINSANAIDDVNLFVKGTAGNHVIVTMPLYYHGFTRIDPKAVLQVGDGTKGKKIDQYRFYNKQIQGMDAGVYSTSSGSGLILTADAAKGAAGDRIINNGTLIVANAKNAISGVGALTLSDVSGRGDLQQRGPATLTLLSHLTYTGRTTVSAGTLTLGTSRRGPASLAASSAVRLTGKTARLNLSAAVNQKLHNLSGVPGSQIILGPRQLTVNSTKNTTFAGVITATSTKAGLVKTGPGTLTFGGRSTGGRFVVSSGILNLGGGSTRPAISGPVSVAAHATLSAMAGTVTTLSTAGTLDLQGPLTVRNSFVQRTASVLRINPATATRAVVTTSGPVRLGGSLQVTKAPDGAAPVVIVKNTGKTPVQGTFTRVPEGALVSAAGVQFAVSYRGGDGNDVTLTRHGKVPSAASATGSSDLTGSIGLAAGLTHAGAGWLLAIPVFLAGGLGFVLFRRRSKSRPVAA